MAHQVEEVQEVKPQKKKWRPSIDGRWGISVMLGSRELFVGVSVSRIDVAEFLKVKRRILPGKGRVREI